VADVPGAEAVAAAAAVHGFSLDAEEAGRWRSAVATALAGHERFLADAPAGEPPPLLFPERAPGRRPTPDEDPHRAWLWRCDIGGPPGGDGLLGGRTVAFKDHVAVAGIPLTFGSQPLDGRVCDTDATVVTRVLAAGGRVIGKHQLFGFTGGRGLAYGVLGDFGDPVHTVDPGRLTGGSSSGSAVAVAAGEVDVAFGGDQAGSIRIPAAWCGVLGLKPTFGLVSHAGVTHGADPTFDHVGPLTRTVADAAAALDAVAGFAGDDPRQDRTVPDGTATLAELDRGVAGLRVGLLVEGADRIADDATAAALARAVEALAAAGAAVVEVSVPEHRDVLRPAGLLLGEAYATLRRTGGFPRGLGPPAAPWPTGPASSFEALQAEHGDALKTYYKLHFVLAELSRQAFGGRLYAAAQNARGRFTRAYDRALADLDVLVMPTCLGVAPRRPPAPGPLEGWRRQLAVLGDDVEAMVANTLPFSYTGHPALSAPCRTGTPLPAGVQLVGRRYGEGTLLRAAAVLEASDAWFESGDGVGNRIDYLSTDR
jgi:amidase